MLSDETGAQEVLAFAQRRGPLAIWPYQVSLAPPEGAYRLSEPVDYYWGLARRMRTLLLLAQHLRGFPISRPAAADLRELLGWVPARGEEGLNGALAGIITQWMRCVPVHPALGMDSQGTGSYWDDHMEAERRLGREYLQPGQRYKSLSLLPREGQRASPSSESW